ncbi:bifunctional hydroxymethylpyrimidine kinase/phosphomethylpyrimidine kinase [Teredinibacter purpureus]|uniref:bifunctional hydroxymethylpyrimidine kinase/phosphomethylpyrimidine kinase n=1 Tax=Teredinibacter purpureus TaxID=2731756 RepID=UPI0005F87856|nr:bifunctional hydroxymethylpyrimidine kinase/phosphomethylpyrimidine kinase [Teredinibacter purpureus]
MIKNNANPPIILSLGALDPSGSGGLQADIETAASLGCHCAPVVTSLSSAGAGSDIESTAVDSSLLITQARSVLDNMNVAAIKIGFLGSVANTEAVHTIIHALPSIPVVAHPALLLWDSDDEEQNDLPEAFFSLIVPQLKIGVFSLYEARTISRESDTLATTAQALTSNGCEYVLITGTGHDHPCFQNSSFNIKGLVQEYHWEQEPPTCHGASSTLAMSTCAYLAHGGTPQMSLNQAQNYTWQTMCASRELGFSIRTPHRFFWADKNIESSQDLPATKKSH